MTPPFSSSSLSDSSCRSRMLGIPIRSVQRRIDAGADALPFVAEMLEPTFTFRRHGVIDALAAIDAFAARSQRPAFLEGVQHGVDDTFAEPDRFLRDEAHRFDDLVTVHLAAAQHSEHEQLRDAGQEWRIRLRHGCEDRPISVYWPVRFSDLITPIFPARNE